MLKIITRPWAALRWALAVVFPMFAAPGATGVRTPTGRWAARLVLVGLVTVLLGLVNNWDRVGLRNWIVAVEPIDRIWLPLFGLCLYALVWLIWWLWHVLSLDVEPGSEFPDIDDAWARATDALAKAGIGLESTPLYLIFGQPPASEDALYQAGGIRPLVNQVPREPGAPIHVTANRDGIWVTCPGASAAGLLADARETRGADPYGVPEFTQNELKTIGAEGTLAIPDLLKRIDELKKHGPSRRAVDAEPQKARLAHLCRLIRRDRLGYCPINGVLLVVPVTAADPEQAPGQFATLCRTDLNVAFDVFRMRCPVLVLISEIDKLPGFPEMIERLPSKQLRRRVGQRFPLVPDVSADQIDSKIRGAVDWITETVLPGMVYALFRVETPGGEGVTDVLEGNSAILKFLTELREREGKLAELISSCCVTPSDEPLLFGGCYLAGTGADPATQQAFAEGVFKRLIEDQDLVSWTRDALESDRRDHTRARLASVALGILITLGALAATGQLAARYWSRPQEEATP
jgi:hypothetical protein